MAEPESPVLQAALGFADRGWLVFPLAPGTKVPLKGSRGFRDATADRERIRKWWKTTPSANVGIATGAESGLLVFDVDPRNGGAGTLAGIVDRHGRLPPTLAVKTVHTGSHYYFRHPRRRVRSRKFARGIDLKADGGYVVAPPSKVRHSETERLVEYVWEGVGVLPDRHEIADPPEWLLSESMARQGVAPAHREGLIRNSEKYRLADKLGTVRVWMEDKGEPNGKLLVDCPYKHLHSSPTTETHSFLFVTDDGEVHFHCHHESCSSDVPTTLAFEDACRSKLGGDGLDAPGGGVSNDDFTVVPFSEIKPETIDWVWQDRIAAGKVTIVAGEPGLGKSMLTCEFAAAISRGRPMPDDQLERHPAAVVMLNAEDAPGDTIGPRLAAMGADMGRVHNFGSVGKPGSERLPSLVKDLQRIETVIQRTSARLVIVDPIQAYLGGKLDVNRTNEVREVMAALKMLAERQGVAFVVVMHLNKSSATTITGRLNGSVDFVAAARSVLLVGRDPDDSDARVILRAKSNLPGHPLPQKFLIEEGRLEWAGGRKDIAEGDLLSTDLAPRLRASATDSAAEFLREVLSEGSLPAREIHAEAERLGISRNALFAAKKKLKIASKKDGLQGGHRWMMPSADPADEFQSAQEGYSSKGTDRYPSENQLDLSKSIVRYSSNSTVLQGTGPFGTERSSGEEEVVL